MAVQCLGYIVCDNLPIAMQVDANGVLWRGRRITVFPTRAAALTAIDRTNAYAERHGYTRSWGTSYSVHLATTPRTQAVAKNGRRPVRGSQPTVRGAGSRKPKTR